MSEESKVKIAKEILENFNKQIILYGPPGTSKTYYSTLIAASIIKDKVYEDTEYGDAKSYLEGEGKKYYQLVQFHPSYNYDDFVRGIKMSIDNGTPKYEIVNKVFGEFAEKAAKDPDHKYVLVIDEINRAPLASVLGELIYGLEYRERKVTIPYAYERESDELTIEGDTKIRIENIETEESNGSGNKSGEYYTDKNGFVMKNKNKVYTSDGNEITIKSVGGKKKLMELINYIVVPVNLYIIGTMNTADRSIGSIDYAVRRRFSFISLPSDWKIVEASWNNMINKYFDEKIQQKQEQQKKEATNKRVNNGIKNLYNAINELKYSADVNKEDIMIGHSYFLYDANKFKVTQIKEQTEAQKSELDCLYKRIEKYFQYRLDYEIKPILREYVKDGLIENGEVIEKLSLELNCEEQSGSAQPEHNKGANTADTASAS